MRPLFSGLPSDNKSKRSNDMAQYSGAWRTNRFKVRDDAAFQEWTDRIPDVDAENGENGWLLCMASYSDNGYLPGSIVRADAESPPTFEDYEDLDFLEGLMDHVAEDSTCIVMATGHEKLRYLSGVAYAIRGGSRDLISVSLEDIYEMAKAAWGGEPRPAEYDG
jgi:hypothetical protein